MPKRRRLYSYHSGSLLLERKETFKAEKQVVQIDITIFGDFGHHYHRVKARLLIDLVYVVGFSQHVRFSLYYYNPFRILFLSLNV